MVLAASGVWLWFEYLPETEYGDRQAMQVVHRLAGRAAEALVLSLLVLHLLDPAARRRWPWPAWVVLAVLVSGFSGFLLPWDNLALWAVTTGKGIDGVDPIFTDAVRFVLVGGVEVGVGTYRLWSVVHVLLPVVGIALPAAAWALRRRWQPRRDPDPGCSTTTSRT